jgi:hypothetical protein
VIQEYLPKGPCNRSTFHSLFISLKERLSLSNHSRKYQIDSLLKKCKSKIFKIIKEGLKRCLLVKIKRLPQSFITNIKIEFNKRYLDKTLLEIFEEFGIFSLNNLINKNSIKSERLELFNEFIRMRLRDVFKAYLTSKNFESELSMIKEKEDEKFAILYEFISRIFVEYYTYSKGNKPKNFNKRIRFSKNVKIFKIIKDELNDSNVLD